VNHCGGAAKGGLECTRLKKRFGETNHTKPLVVTKEPVKGRSRVMAVISYAELRAGGTGGGGTVNTSVSRKEVRLHATRGKTEKTESIVSHRKRQTTSQHLLENLLQRKKEGSGERRELSDEEGAGTGVGSKGRVMKRSVGLSCWPALVKEGGRNRKREGSSNP